MKRQIPLFLRNNHWDFRIKLGYLLIILFLSCFSCNKKNKPAEETDQAVEFQKVIDHYKNIDKNQLKAEAAAYLIENLQHHEAKYAENPHIELFEGIGNSKSDKERNIHQNEFETLDYEEIDQKRDDQTVTSSFLISNIDLAFKAWRTYPWSKYTSFQDFKSYILPYRMSNEPIEECRTKFQEKYKWLIDSMKSSSDMEKAFTLIYNNFYSEYSSTGTSKYPIPMSYSQFIAAKRGTCEDACNTLGMILRSMGIKCVFDYSVQWGNQKPTMHSWVAYPKTDALTFYIDKEPILQIPQYIHSGKFSIDTPGGNFLVNKIKPQYYKKGTKVRRLTFHKNRSSLTLRAELPEMIQGNWNELCSIDITDRYIQSANFELNIDKKFSNKRIIYLSVFNDKIVDFAEIKNDKVSFSNIGIDNIYFPMIYNGSKLCPATNPFILKRDGKVAFIKANLDKTQNITLTRKYPLLAYNLNNANYLFHGQFQGANTSDFREPTNLFKINETYLFPTSIKFKNYKKFRYLRFIPEKSRKLSIAEIAFYSGKRVITGKIITNSKEPFHEKDNAFDNDYTTICQKDKGTWIGIDLGQGRKEIISKIAFCPRNDSNFIIPGNEYELFYWNKEWVSIKKTVAIGYELIFKNVPKGALLWLHCINGGLEERPFTYENGNQIWW